MRRVLFHWFGRPVHSYPAMLYLGTVLGFYAQLYAAVSIGLHPASTLAATLLLLITCSARRSVAARRRQLARLPGAPQRRILQFSNGGASMYGGLLLAVPLSLPLLAALGIPFGSFLGHGVFHPSRRHDHHAGRVFPERMLCRPADFRLVGDQPAELRRSMAAPRSRSDPGNRLGLGRADRGCAALGPPVLSGRFIPLHNRRLWRGAHGTGVRARRAGSHQGHERAQGDLGRLCGDLALRVRYRLAAVGHWPNKWPEFREGEQDGRMGFHSDAAPGASDHIFSLSLPRLRANRGPRGTRTRWYRNPTTNPPITAATFWAIPTIPDW